MLRDGPILFDAVDRDSYVPRPHLEEALWKAANAGGGVLLLGSSGSGRTTLLNWLARRLREGGTPVARVDAALASDPKTVLSLVREGLRRAHRDFNVTRNLAVDTPVGSTAPEAVQLQQATRQLAIAPPTAVLLDNLSHPGATRTIFGGLRDILWETGHRWIVSARRPDRAFFLAPPADAFFADRVDIPPLSEVELQGFLDRSGLGTRAAFDRLTEVPPLPRDVVRALRRDNGASTEVGRARDIAGDVAADVLREITALERPVGPDDGDLQVRTNLSETTLRRYLNRLAKHGFLETLDDRTGDPGRPRKLYWPIDGGRR